MRARARLPREEQAEAEEAEAKAVADAAAEAQAGRLFGLAARLQAVQRGKWGRRAAVRRREEARMRRGSAAWGGERRDTAVGSEALPGGGASQR